VGPGSTCTRPTDAGPALEVAGLALRGVFDLVPALERLLAADLAMRLADGDPMPRGSTLIGDPAWLALDETAVEAGVVFDTAAARLEVDGNALETGLQFLGSLIGDHAKTAIGTLLGTGTVIGAGANVFDAVRPPKYVPPFAWGGSGQERMRREGFLKVAERVL